MHRKVYLALLSILAILFLAGPTILGCAPKAPAKPKVVKIGAAWDMTGAASSVAVPSVKAMEDYIRYINTEKGGVEGVKIEFEWADTGYRVDRAVAAYKRFVEEKVVAVSPMAAGDIEAIKDMAARDKVPLYVVSPSIPAMSPTPHPWVFSSIPMVGDGFTAFLMWLKDNWKQPRPARVAIMGWDSPYGREPESTAKFFASKLGVEVVSTQRISPIATEAASQLVAMDKEKPDFIFTTTVAAPAAMILRDAKRLGVWPRVPMVGNHWDASDEAVAIGKAELFEGYMGVRPLASWEEDVPYIKLAKDLQTKYQGAVVPQIGYELGSVQMITVAEALRIAIKDVGWEKVDGDALRKAFYKIKNFDTGGITPPMTFSPEDHRGSPYEKIVKVQGGKIVPVSNWIKVPLPK